MDEETGKVGYFPVTAQNNSEYEQTWHLTIRDVETGVEQVIRASHNHPIFAVVPEGTALPATSEGRVYRGDIPWGAWVDVADLQAGYRLLNPDDTWAEIVSVEERPEPLVAYNLTVDQAHTYFVAEVVGDVGVWVHNVDCDDVPGKRIADENGVTVEHYGTSDAHKPTHAHVKGKGQETRVGPNGKPLKGQPELTPQQSKIVKKSKKEIRKELRKDAALSLFCWRKTLPRLQYQNARYSDPALGQFTSAD